MTLTSRKITLAVEVCYINIEVHVNLMILLFAFVCVCMCVFLDNKKARSTEQMLKKYKNACKCSYLLFLVGI